MAIALVFNPGSNSLKFELVELDSEQGFAGEANKLASAVLDGIGKDTKLLVMKDGKTVSSEKADAADMTAGTHAAVEWLRKSAETSDVLQRLSFAGVRVVHGGPDFAAAARATPEVRQKIEALEDLAPLHNQGSLNVLDVVAKEMPDVPAFVTFDTAFHRSLPEKAWRYPIERETADRHGVRKYGFHGVSHRYMLELYARTVGKRSEECTVVALHLESGASACAIQRGRSVDTTMGLTPLEGLMMGSRSGSVDPAIVPYLMRKENKTADDILRLLNKRSGLLGVAGGTLDTRELVKRDDDAAKLALSMFSYRVRLAVGAYLAALGDAEAVLFGGGIGEDSPWLREDVCAGLTGWGLQLDPEANKSAEGMVRISAEQSRLHAWAVPTDEGLQMAHECLQAMSAER
ncbi:acetate/propionate family kinase [Terriglobus sp.]|uniref:acetate/propionate family kinase n=1 Tax=Terriglobus sp. TaxID=1889013 RepID=UPI003B00B635